MKKKEYIRPEVTVVEFRVEKGFATSGFMTAIFGSASSNGVEQYDEREGWSNDNNNSFF